MRITAAEWKAGKLILTTSDPDAVRFAFGFKGEGEYSLSPAKKKRSLDANAFSWVLIDKLAVALGLTKTEVYRNAIKEIGGNSEIVLVKDEAVGEFCRSWESRGLGWLTDQMPSAYPGMTTVVCYTGSSQYDAKQMSRLIDNLIQDAKAVGGIEVLPPHKLAGMMEAWDARSKRL